MKYHRQSVPSPGSSLWETLPWYEYNGRVTSGDPNTVFISNVALFTPPKLRSRLEAAAGLMAGPSAAVVVERKDTSAAGEAAAAAAAAWLFWLKRRD